VNHILAGRNVRGEGDFVHIAQPEKGRNIGFVRLGGQRVAEKENEVDFAVGDFGADFLIAAQRTRAEAFDVQTGGFDDFVSGGPGGEQLVVLQNVFMFDREFDHVGFHFVMGNHGDAHQYQLLGVSSTLFYYSTPENDRQEKHNYTGGFHFGKKPFFELAF
jgi:hypothetical protein